MHSDSDSTAKGKPFFGKFQLRQSFQDADSKQSPAQILLTLPSSGGSNWLVDAGAALTLGQLSSDIFTSKLVGEFHRNTLVDIAQYNWQLGYNFSWFKDRGNFKLAPIWTGNAKYVRDVIDTTHSIVGSMNLSFYQSGRGSLNLGRPAYLSSEKYTYQIDPSIEVQYQQYLGNDSRTGAIIRPLVNLAASFAWNKKPEMKEVTKVVNGKKVKSMVREGKAPTKFIEVAANYINRYSVVNRTGNEEGYSKLFKAGLNYYFINTEKSSVSIGGNYNLGSDPLTGLKDQNFWEVALQVQL
jgi:hypothetical protein